MLADAATAIGLFCLAIVMLVPLGDYLTGLVKTPALSSIDRSLGFVFGVLRGFVIMCLLYLGTTFIWPQGQSQPVWLQGARTAPTLAYGVEALKGLVPDNPDELVSEKMKRSRDAAKEAVDDAKHLDDISTAVPVSKSGAESKAHAYGDDIRGEMDNLMDQSGDK